MPKLHRPKSNPKQVYAKWKDKNLLYRTDTDKNLCRYNDMLWSTTQAFIKVCKARQESNEKFAHGAAFKQFYSCRECVCGSDVMAGRRVKLPKNHRLIK